MAFVPTPVSSKISAYEKGGVLGLFEEATLEALELELEDELDAELEDELEEEPLEPPSLLVLPVGSEAGAEVSAALSLLP